MYLQTTQFALYTEMSLNSRFWPVLNTTTKISVFQDKNFKLFRLLCCPKQLTLQSALSLSRMDSGNDVTFFDITQKPLVATGDGVKRASMRLSLLMAENIQAEVRLPPTMGVCMDNFKSIQVHGDYSVPPYDMMQVARILPPDAPDGAMYVEALPSCKLSVPIKTRCIHAPTPEEESVTTTELSGHSVCKMCASNMALTRWSKGLVDAKACVGQRVLNIDLTPERMFEWALNIPAHNGYGIFRVGAIRMLGHFSLFEIASMGCLAPVNIPPPMYIAEYVIEEFPGEIAKMIKETGKNDAQVAAYILKIFGEAAQVSSVKLECQIEMKIADIVLKSPGIFCFDHSKTRLIQPGWEDVESWKNQGIAVDGRETATVTLYQDTDIERVVESVSSIDQNRTLIMNIAHPKLPMPAIAAILKIHPVTKIVLKCWHPISYILYH